LWKARSKQGYTKSFDEFLDEEGVVDELLQMSSAVPLAATSQSNQA
jgi:hypothetical protein